MYEIKLMIVEDEDILREGIRRVGNWESHGVRICGLASNGKEALALIDEEKPDVILTDVVMPIMDGIELTKQVYEKYPDIRVIILSGYEEFQFVKRAIEYKACNYLLKPAKIENIVEAVCEVRDGILAEKKRYEEDEKMRSKLKESIPVLREHYMNRLIMGVAEEAETVKTQFQFLNIELSIENLAILVCELESKGSDKGVTVDSRISGLQLTHICREIIEREYVCCVFSDLKERVVTILNYLPNMKDKDIMLYLSGKAVRIQNEMVTQYGKTVSVGVGRSARDIRYLGKIYKEAVSALTYRFFMGSQSVIYIGDVEQKDEGGLQYLEQMESEIIVCLKTGDSEGTSQQIEKYFALFDQFAIRDQDFIYEEIIVFITNTLRDLRSKEDAEGKSWLLDSMNRLHKSLRKNAYLTLKELKDQVKETFCKTADNINKNRLLRSEGLIDKAKGYVKKHISQDVSLITVAEAVYVSPNYLSFLFKENGENFKEYVVRVKMEEADEMMKSGNYNLTQIAYALGYKDGRYFSQVYKKFMGK